MGVRKSGAGLNTDFPLAAITEPASISPAGAVAVLALTVATTRTPSAVFFKIAVQNPVYILYAGESGFSIDHV